MYRPLELFIFIASVALSGVHDVHAALIAPAFDNDGFVSATVVASHSKRAQVPGNPHSRIPNAPDRPEEPKLRQHGLIGGMASGTAGSISPTSSSVASPVPLVDPQAAVTGCTLTLYLQKECRLVLTVPFLEGVFRPPRN